FSQETMSINSIENLSDELFYEIFDYLNGCEIDNAFSNLNYRFHQLINSSSLLFKIRLGYYSRANEIFMNNYKRILLLNKNQILSIHLWISENTNQIISLFNIDSSFNCLESLMFNSIEPDVLISVLPKLTCLPRLFSLTIGTWSIQNDLGDIYRLIFNLKKLKYIKFTSMDSNDYDIIISLPIVTNEQISSIEYLNINHACAFDEIFAI
ncbi:unnamed protein product, partial [Rotaria sordida]